MTVLRYGLLVVPPYDYIIHNPFTERHFLRFTGHLLFAICRLLPSDKVVITLIVHSNPNCLSLYHPLNPIKCFFALMNCSVTQRLPFEGISLYKFVRTKHTVLRYILNEWFDPHYKTPSTKIHRTQPVWFLQTVSISKFLDSSRLPSQIIGHHDLE